MGSPGPFVRVTAVIGGFRTVPGRYSLQVLIGAVLVAIPVAVLLRYRTALVAATA